MQEVQGLGTTRIDTFITNWEAAHACKQVTYMHHNAIFDHGLIQVTLNTTRFTDEVDVAQKPVKLIIRGLQGMTCKQRADVRTKEKELFHKICRTRKLTSSRQ